MCGRYVAPEPRTAREILDSLLAGRLERQFAIHEMAAEGSFEAYPSVTAPFIRYRQGKPAVLNGTWGFGKGARLIFNARQESALQKPLFRDSLLQRRCVIPTLGYYEWDAAHKRYRILDGKCQILLLAGIYHRQPGEPNDRFCVLTTDAAPSLAAIHPRMPVILRPEELQGWFSGDSALELLHRTTDLCAAADAAGS